MVHDPNGIRPAPYNDNSRRLLAGLASRETMTAQTNMQLMKSGRFERNRSVGLVDRIS